MLVLPALGGAAQSQTADVGLKCKFPLASVKPVELQTKLELPSKVRVDQVIPNSTAKIKVTIHDLGSTIDAVPSIARVSGTATLNATAFTPGGFNLPATNTANINAPVAHPSSDLITANVQSPFPGFAFGDPGVVTLNLTTVTANLTAYDASGVPVVLQPSSRDADGNPVTDSDGDPNTFDVRCSLAAGQSGKLATITVRR